MIELRVGGKRYGGFKSATISRSIEALSGAFALEVSERWAEQHEPWPIGDGDECKIVINGETLVTGFLDTREPHFDTSDAGVLLRGRDRAADIVDCSAMLDRWEFKNISALSLVQKLCEPYGVAVSLQAGLSLANVSLWKKFSIDPGDTVGSAIENVCRVAGILAVSDGSGGIVLTRAGTARVKTALVQGENMKAGRATFSKVDRFHDYAVLGSHKGTAHINGHAAASIKGIATDEDVRAARTLIIRPEGNVTAAQATQRAQWEASVRVGRSISASVTVAGWTREGGKLWPINELVAVWSPRLNLNGDLLIVGADFSLTHDGGKVTTLTLKPAGAFTPQPVIKPGAGVGLWKEIARGV